MEYSIVAIVLLIGMLVYFKVADKFNIIDKPNERSSHTQITLRGGGVIFYFGALMFFITSHFAYPYFFVGLTLMAVISFLDDLYSLPNRLRIFVHSISMLLVFYQLNLYDLAWWWILPAFIVCIGTINAYNFMDGINGITAANSLAVLALLYLVNGYIPFIEEEFLVYVSISVLVFSLFNFRTKAKCFAGDVGSVSIAFIILFLIIKLILQTNNLIYILFLLVYGLDTVGTIIRRLQKGENIFEAHRSHLYQFLANEDKKDKLMVSFSYGIIQLVVGLVIIYFAKNLPEYQGYLAVSLFFFGALVYLYIKNQLIKKHNL